MIGRTVSPKVAAFALIGMVLWTSRWYRPEGQFHAREIGKLYSDLFIDGLVNGGNGKV